MATAPFNLDITDPADNAVVSNFPGNERPFRDNAASYLNTDHDINTGHHKLPYGNTASFAAMAFPQGALRFNTTTSNLEVSTVAGTPGTWVPSFSSEFASGTSLPFHNATAPTGWTQDASVNDAVIRIIGSGVPGTGGSWTISGTTVTVATHVLSVTEIPSHTHNFNAYLNTAGLDFTNAGAVAIQTGTGTTDGGTGGGGAHGHTGSTFTNDGTWRPAYEDFIVAVKN